MGIYYRRGRKNNFFALHRIWRGPISNLVPSVADSIVVASAVTVVVVLSGFGCVGFLFHC